MAGLFSHQKVDDWKLGFTSLLNVDASNILSQSILIRFDNLQTSFISKVTVGEKPTVFDLISALGAYKIISNPF